jgi:hypothetical protein
MENRPNDLTLTIAKLVALSCSIAAVPYGAMRIQPHPFVGLMLWGAPLLAVVFWLQKGAHRTGVGTVLDLGYFVFVAWPIAIPWYAFATRGGKEWRLTAGLFAMIAAPYLTWIAVAFLVWYFGSDV